jgi:hypothetical protein
MAHPFKCELTATRCRNASRLFIVQTYFFDIKDGVTVRDRSGVSFRLDSEAIEHSKMLAREMRQRGRDREANLRVCVTNESGSQIHEELVGPDLAR